jgi:hypothetical protein
LGPGGRVAQGLADVKAQIDADIAARAQSRGVSQGRIAL